MRFLLPTLLVGCGGLDGLYTEDAPPESVEAPEPEVTSETTDTTEPTPEETEIEPLAVDCSPIAADPGFELCEESDAACSGVFTDGSSCDEFCGAADLVCAGRYGGDVGCQLEADTPIGCGANNGHQSDWCDCALPADLGDCATSPGQPDRELGMSDAIYSERHNWVVNCREYAYTASGDEHEACDADYHPDGSREGTASFVFSGVPRGTYDVYVGGRHTENRNPSGALFVVDGHPVVVDQTEPTGDLVWDLHGTWCLEGDVDVVLDSTANSGSDSVFGARLVPVY